MKTDVNNNKENHRATSSSSSSTEPTHDKSLTDDKIHLDTNEISSDKLQEIYHSNGSTSRDLCNSSSSHQVSDR